MSFISLLQLQHRRGPSSPALREVIISPASNLMKFVGRYDVAGPIGQQKVRFDAAGFEVQFQVTGTTEVKVALSQKISGPHGWFFDDGHDEEDFTDACMRDSKSSPKVQLLSTTSRLSFGAGMFPSGSQPHHFLVYVDGVPQRQPSEKKHKCQVCSFDTSEAVSGQVQRYTVASGLDPSKTHDIRIVKTSEPDFTSAPALVPNWVSLHALILDRGSAQLPNTSRDHRVEFIGDSWMAGYCNTCNGGNCTDGPVAGSSMAGDSPDTFRWGSYALAWPHLVCEELQAECHSTVMSGTGVHCVSHPRFQQNDCSQDLTLPTYWQRTLSSDATSHWDFKAWTPEIIVMSVNSNEHFNDPVRDKDAVLQSYNNFLDTLYNIYPDVHVLLVCQDKDVAAMCEYAKKLVADKKETGARVDLLDAYHIPERSEQKLCCGHPGEDYHKVIRDHVVQEVRRIMSW